MIHTRVKSSRVFSLLPSRNVSTGFTGDKGGLNGQDRGMQGYICTLVVSGCPFKLIIRMIFLAGDILPSFLTRRIYAAGWNILGTSEEF